MISQTCLKRSRSRSALPHGHGTGWSWLLIHGVQGQVDEAIRCSHHRQRLAAWPASITPLLLLLQQQQEVESQNSVFRDVPPCAAKCLFTLPTPRPNLQTPLNSDLGRSFAALSLLSVRVSRSAHPPDASGSDLSRLPRFPMPLSLDRQSRLLASRRASFPPAAPLPPIPGNLGPPRGIWLDATTRLQSRWRRTCLPPQRWLAQP